MEFKIRNDEILKMLFQSCLLVRTKLAQFEEGKRCNG